jgi:hypothetical protein
MLRKRNGKDGNGTELLSALRDELLARNEIRRLRQRGEEPSESLKIKLSETSVKNLLEKLGNLTALPGGESRIELFAAIPQVKDMGNSVALICSKADLAKPTPQRTNWRLNGVRFLCDGQNFAGEPGLASRNYTPATGFLVGDSGRYLLTARHIVVDNNGRLVPQLYCVFGYRMENNGPVQLFPPTDVVLVSNLIAYGGNTEEQDWALVELETSTGRAGLPLRTNGNPAVQEPVIAIGYPHGLPIKAGTGAIRDMDSPLYKADLDIGGGNSGSPVVGVNANGVPLYVEGIVVRADSPDIIPANELGCMVWVKASPPNKPEYWAGFVPIANVLADARFRAAVSP